MGAAEFASLVLPELISVLGVEGPVVLGKELWVSRVLGRCGLSGVSTWSNEDTPVHNRIEQRVRGLLYILNVSPSTPPRQ